MLLLLWLSGSIDERYEYYEKLQVDAVTHHMEKRAADRSSFHEKVISIDALSKYEFCLGFTFHVMITEEPAISTTFFFYFTIQLFLLYMV